MAQFISLAVLAAALLDAIMHLMLKAERDSHAMSILTGILGGGCWVWWRWPLPACLTAAWPWLGLSVLWGAAYWLMLGRAYQSGALGLVFPVARGSAVLLSTLVAAVALNETLSGGEILTVRVIVCGLATVAYTALPQKFGLVTLGPTMLLAAVMAGYTLTDAMGVRAAGSSVAYCAALYVGNSLVLSLSVARTGTDGVRALGATALPRSMMLATMSAVIYGAVLFALQGAPVALVAALAESSIVFAALLGVFWLREPARAAHAFGVFVIAGGVGLLHFAG